MRDELRDEDERLRLPRDAPASADAVVARRTRETEAHAEIARRTAEFDAAVLGAFRAGLDAAATFHEQRAAFAVARRDHARANPSWMPDDVRGVLIEDWTLDASQDRADARLIRDLPAPASLPAAAVEADTLLRAQHAEHLAEMQERLRARGVRCETLTREVEQLKAQLAAVRVPRRPHRGERVRAQKTASGGLVLPFPLRGTKGKVQMVRDAAGAHLVPSARGEPEQFRIDCTEDSSETIGLWLLETARVLRRMWCRDGGTKGR